MKNLAIFCFIFAFLGSHLIAGKSVGNSVNLKENLVSKDNVVANSDDPNKSEPPVEVNTQNTNATAPKEPDLNTDDSNKSEPPVEVNTQNTNATAPKEPDLNTDDSNKSEPPVEVNTQNTNATAPEEPDSNPDDSNKSEPPVEVNTQNTNSTAPEEPDSNPDDSNKSEPPVEVNTQNTNSTAPEEPTSTKAPTTESLVKHKYKMSGGATAGIIVAVLAVFVVLGGVYYHYSSKRLPKTKNASISLKESRSKAFNKDS